MNPLLFSFVKSASLRGPNVKLRRLTQDDVPALKEWQKDISNLRTVTNWSRFINDPHAYGIMARGKFAGIVGLKLNADRTSADVYIGMAPKFRGLGYGAEALDLIKGYGLFKLRLNDIRLSVSSENPRAMNLYNRSGFKRTRSRGGMVRMVSS